MIQDYKQKKKELYQKFDREVIEIEEGKQFEPLKWIPDKSKIV